MGFYFLQCGYTQLLTKNNSKALPGWMPNDYMS